MEGKTPGNGSTSPFGNGDGATQATGASSGAHDFIKDPKAGSPGGGGRDFTKDNRPQQMGGMGANPDTVPPGGRLPFPDVDGQADEGKDIVASPRKSFTVRGEGGGSPSAGATSSVGVGGGGSGGAMVGESVPSSDEDY